MTKSVKVANFPKHVKITSIKAFFKGLSTSFIKMNNNGSGTVEFKKVEDAQEAAKRNKTLFDEKRVIMVRLLNTDDKPDIKSKSEIEPKPSFSDKTEEDIIEEIMDTGRLFLRNLYYGVTESEIVDLFKQYGDLIEVTVPLDYINKRPKGFAYVTFTSPEEAVKAYKALNKTKLGDRKVHILASAEKPDNENTTEGIAAYDDEEGTEKKFQQERMEKLKSSSSSAHNWNTMFVNNDVVAQYLADKLNITKSDLYAESLKGSMSVKLAMAETQLVMLIQQFLEENDINVEELKNITNRGPKSKVNVAVSFALSSTTFIVKNLTPGVTKDDIYKIFHKYDGLDNILLPPYGVTAIVTYKTSQQAKVAYLNCSYMLMNDTVLMLQWAPMGLFKSKVVEKDEIITQETESVLKSEKSKKRKASKEVKEDVEISESKVKKSKIEEKEAKEVVEISESKTEEITEKRSTKLIVKNLSFQATKKELEELFGAFNGLTMVRMTKKEDGGHRGFAFLEFETEDDAQKVKETMGISTHLLGRRLVLEYSHGV